MLARKTFYVAKLRDEVNIRLQDSTCTPEARFAMASILAGVLHETGNYRGYTYLSQYCDPYTHMPTDESRRFYF